MSTILQHRHPGRASLAAWVGLVLLAASGCQTPQTATVAPPATGMIGQPAQYGSWATPPQGAAYPPTVSAPPMPAPGGAPPPMPGPATQWQAAAPAPPAAANGNSWSWSQPSSGAPPSMQQYGNQLQAQANQYQQNMTNQAQQYANQMQQQPQQYANQMQQYANQQTQQMSNQLQNTANQYTQGLNNQVQQGMQSAQQQVTAQMPTYQPTQATNTTWNPFATPAQSLPPARSTPTTVVPRY